MKSPSDLYLETEKFRPPYAKMWATSILLHKYAPVIIKVHAAFKFEDPNFPNWSPQTVNMDLCSMARIDMQIFGGKIRRDHLHNKRLWSKLLVTGCSLTCRLWESSTSFRTWKNFSLYCRMNKWNLYWDASILCKYELK